MRTIFYFGGRRNKKKNKQRRIEVSTYTQNVQKKKKLHPVFEKLEFYLNLKNDFALNFYTRQA